MSLLMMILGSNPNLVICRGRHVPVQCPPAELIAPCQCRSRVSPQVKCTNVYGLESVRNALNQRFPHGLRTLHITDSNILALPDHAFANISVSRLLIDGNNIRQIDEDAFAGQEDLLFLSLQNDRLFDVPVSALSRLTQLRALILSDNLLIFLGQDSFADLDRLINLVLRNNRISHIEHGVFPPNLEALSLSGNLLTTLNRTLTGLSHLGWLFLFDNRLTSIKGELDGLEKLEVLYLSNNQISDLEDSLDDLSSLEVLDVSYNNLHRLGNSLKGLTSLQNLDLSFNYLTELESDAFSSLSQLTRLDLSGNQLMTLSSSLTYLGHLHRLNLSANDLTSIQYEDLKGLLRLRELDLSHNKLGNLEGTFGFQVAELTELKLQGNQLKRLHRSLKNLRDLKVLDVRDNQMTTLHVSQLVHNRQLEILQIGGNPLSCEDDHLHDALKDFKTRMVEVSGQPFCDYLDENTL